MSDKNNNLDSKFLDEVLGAASNALEKVKRKEAKKAVSKMFSEYEGHLKELLKANNEISHLLSKIEELESENTKLTIKLKELYTANSELKSEYNRKSESWQRELREYKQAEKGDLENLKPGVYKLGDWKSVIYYDHDPETWHLNVKDLLSFARHVSYYLDLTGGVFYEDHLRGLGFIFELAQMTINYDRGGSIKRV